MTPIRPPAVRALTWLLVATAAATALVELLNYRYAPEQGFGLAVRTGWALLRTLGWLVLIWHVRRSRAVSRPLGLILAVTTVFAVGRLIVPRDGAPPLPGLVGFGVLALFCATVVVLLYRHPAVRGHLVRYPAKLVATRKVLEWRESAPRRPPVAAWVITARVAAFTYSPLILVPAVISVGELGARPEYILAVVFWIFVGVGASYAVLLTTFFLQRGKAWARQLMVWVSLGVLLIDLPLCYLLLGVDGLIRDGAPLVAAAMLACYAVWRAGRTAATADSATAAARV